MKNKHGVSRDIPESVRRQVRQDCGFGCIRCGNLRAEYDHFDPEFADLTDNHNADGIALLCGSCHSERNAGLLSSAQVKHLREIAKEKWKSVVWKTSFSGGVAHLLVGNNDIRGQTVGLNCGNINLIQIHAGESESELWALSGHLRDGDNYLELRGNEVVASKGWWDISLEGGSLQINRAQGKIVLKLEMKPSSIIISRLDLTLPRGIRLEVLADGSFRLNTPRIRDLLLSQCVYRGSNMDLLGNLPFDISKFL